MAPDSIYLPLVYGQPKISVHIVLFRVQYCILLDERVGNVANPYDTCSRTETKSTADVVGRAWYALQCRCRRCTRTREVVVNVEITFISSSFEMARAPKRHDPRSIDALLWKSVACQVFPPVERKPFIGRGARKDVIVDGQSTRILELDLITKLPNSFCGDYCAPDSNHVATWFKHGEKLQFKNTCGVCLMKLYGT